MCRGGSSCHRQDVLSFSAYRNWFRISQAAWQAGAIVMTKDSDFAEMVERLGPPPPVIWLTCGNTSNAALRGLLKPTLPKALNLISKGDKLVEISGRS